MPPLSLDVSCSLMLTLLRLLVRYNPSVPTPLVVLFVAGQGQAKLHVPSFQCMTVPSSGGLSAELQSDPSIRQAHFEYQKQMTLLKMEIEKVPFGQSAHDQTWRFSPLPHLPPTAMIGSLKLSCQQAPHPTQMHHAGEG